MASLRTPAELKNCKLENPSLLFGLLAQYLGSDKRGFWVLASHIKLEFLPGFARDVKRTRTYSTVICRLFLYLYPGQVTMLKTDQVFDLPCLLASLFNDSYDEY